MSSKRTDEAIVGREVEIAKYLLVEQRVAKPHGGGVKSVNMKKQPSVVAEFIAGRIKVLGNSRPKSHARLAALSPKARNSLNEFVRDARTSLQLH